MAVRPTPAMGAGGRIRPIASPAPLIAVTTSELRDSGGAVPTPEADPARQEMVLGLKYLTAVERAGGVPIVVPPLPHGGLLNALLDRVAGLVLSGGPDLDPLAYGASRHDRLGPTWRALDESELALARLADARGLPVLGICRGMQTLNVARGGTLHQHLPDLVGEQIHHRQSEEGHRPTHRVALERPSRLAAILRTDDLAVNSFHHQAVAVLGDGLQATGAAPDGTIESLEATDRDFVLGVQWHAECLVEQPHARLFGAFVAAAQRFASSPALMRRAA